MANLLKIFSHNLHITLKTIKTAVKLVSITIATMEVALELYRAVISDNAPSSLYNESTQPTMEVGELINNKSTQMRRKKRQAAD